MNEAEELSDDGDDTAAYQANQERMNEMHAKVFCPKLGAGGSLTASS